MRSATFEPGLGSHMLNQIFLLRTREIRRLNQFNSTDLN